MSDSCSCSGGSWKPAGSPLFPKKTPTTPTTKKPSCPVFFQPTHIALYYRAFYVHIIFFSNIKIEMK